MAFWDTEFHRLLHVPVTEGEVVTIAMIALSTGFYGKAARKTSKPVRVHVIVGREKFVVAQLRPGKMTNIEVTLAFDQSFKIFHNGRNGSVLVCGYRYDEKPKQLWKPPVMAIYGKDKM